MRRHSERLRLPHDDARVHPRVLVLLHVQTGGM